MKSPGFDPASPGAPVFWGVVVPIGVTLIILTADWAEGPKTAFVGVLAVVPMLSAVFATARMTALVAVITWLAAFAFGLIAADGNAPAQYIRLFIIALFGVAAVGAAAVRTRIQEELTHAQLEAAEAEAARRDANIDWLTSLLNRRGLDAAFDARRASSGTVIMLDLDQMKQVNDRLGHRAGDELLQAVASRIRASVSESDDVGRWGGDEFVVVLDATVEQARTVSRRIEAHVSGQPVTTSAGTFSVTVSSGLAPFEPGISIDQALSEADQDMYRNKRDDFGEEFSI